MAEQLVLAPRHLERVREILRTHLPGTEVWAYGSRVTGQCQEASDLDLVARNPAALGQALPDIAAALSAFVESDLPIRVDLLDWALLEESFRREIGAGFVVLQTASVEAEAKIHRKA